MASIHVSNTSLLFLILMAVFSAVQGALGGIRCEDLSPSSCAFAVSSSGTRCVLEKRVRRGTGQLHTFCRASEIAAAENLMDWVESEQCVKACGLDRHTVGISTDSLAEPRIMQQICSPKCYQACPNIAHLYSNLAAAEGLFLPKLCAAIESSRPAAAPAPYSQTLASAPAMSELHVAMPPV